MEADEVQIQYLGMREVVDDMMLLSRRLVKFAGMVVESQVKVFVALRNAFTPDM